MNMNNTFYKTFTGADTLAFAMFPHTKPILLGSLTTISYSIYREKKPVPLVGKINTGGFTRGMRSIAGTLIFTLINQHFTKDLLEQIPYLAEHGKMKADELPFFDIMVISANEYGTTASMMIYGAEFVDDAQVISIQDMYIENSFSFVARDLDEFTAKNPLVNKSSSGKTKLAVDTVVPYDFNADGYKSSLKNILDTKNMSMINVQVKLKELGYLNNITGVLDNETSKAISSVQQKYGIMQTGSLDETTYDIIVNGASGTVLTVENKNGTFVYENTNKDKIIGISKYKESFIGSKNGDMYEVLFFGNAGYIKADDVGVSSKSPIVVSNFSEPGSIYKTSYKDFDASIVGANISSTKEIEVQMTAISYFKNGYVDTNTRYFTIAKNGNLNFKLSSISESYIYNTIIDDKPYLVEFIILPQGEKPIKWTVELIK